MPPRKRNRRPRSAARPRGSGPSWRAVPPSPRSAAAPELLRAARRSLRTRTPLDFIAFASGLVAGLDPRGLSPFDRIDHDGPTLAELASTFVDVETEETSALLAAFCALVDDDALVKLMRRELDRRAHSLPGWLERIGDAHIYRTAELVHLLGDGENVVVGVRLHGGHELTTVLYVDHNLGSAAKDGFVVDQPIAQILEMYRVADDGHSTARDIPSADARARSEQAIEHGAMFAPPLQSDTWPACRPVIEWLVRLLPSGGAGYERREWSDEELDEIARAFLASAHGRPFATPDHDTLVHAILWYGSGYGPCDPMRWSPSAAEIFLLDWVPRKIIAPSGELTAAPDVLAAFVRYSDAERGIPPDLTAETLEAIASFAPEYREIIVAHRLHGPAAILAAAGVIAPDDPEWLSVDLPDELPTYREIMLEGLRAEVGGGQALAGLDDRPLPDEPLDRTGIAEDVLPAVDSVAALCDECTMALFDAEFRTACRRLLSVAAHGDPGLFRRRGRPDNLAAAFVWIVGKASHLLGPGRERQVQDLVAYLGLRSPTMSQRARTILAAAGISDEWYTDPRLGRADLVTSARRRDIITLRDYYADPAG